MGFFSTIGRIIIVILNIIFVVVSFFMVVVGVILKFFADNAFIKNLQDELKTALKTLSASTGGTPTDAQIENLNLNEVFGTVSICLIVIGAFLLGVSFFGCCGACYKVQILLILYAGTIGILLLGQIIFLILLYASPAVKDLVRSQLKSSLEEYKGFEGFNVESLLWNAAMTEFKCCGVTDYTDFANHAPNWKNPIQYNGNSETLVTPLACCVQSALTSTDVSCAKTPSSANNYQNTGCFQAIWDKAFDSPIMLAIVLTITFAVQLLLIFFTIMMYRANKNNKVGKV